MAALKSVLQFISIESTGNVCISCYTNRQSSVCLDVILAENCTSYKHTFPLTWKKLPAIFTLKLSQNLHVSVKTGIENPKTQNSVTVLRSTWDYLNVKVKVLKHDV